MSPGDLACVALRTAYAKTNATRSAFDPSDRNICDRRRGGVSSADVSGQSVLGECEL
jgi:hypothetical protein